MGRDAQGVDAMARFWMSTEADEPRSSQALGASANGLHASPLTSASAFSSQYIMRISRYMVVAAVRCS